jgi:hypothetical protein
MSDHQLIRLIKDGAEPTFEGDLPTCSYDACSQYDGKRCRLLGFRPDHFCEPALIDLMAELQRMRKMETSDEIARLTRELAEAQSEAARLRKLFDDAGQGEHNVLALIDFYQAETFESEAKAEQFARELAEAKERVQEYDAWLRAEEAEAGERARVLYLSSGHDENSKCAYHTSKRYADGLSHARIRLLQLVKFPLPPPRYTLLDGNSADVTGTLLDLLDAGPTWTQADVLAIRALGVGERHQLSQHDGIWIRRDE